MSFGNPVNIATTGSLVWRTSTVIYERLCWLYTTVKTSVNLPVHMCMYRKCHVILHVFENLICTHTYSAYVYPKMHMSVCA